MQSFGYVMRIIWDFAEKENFVLDRLVAFEESKTLQNREPERSSLEAKTQSIPFKWSRARELVKAGIPYRKNYCKGIITTNFLKEWNRERYPYSEMLTLSN